LLILPAHIIDHSSITHRSHTKNIATMFDSSLSPSANGSPIASTRETHILPSLKLLSCHCIISWYIASFSLSFVIQKGHTLLWVGMTPLLSNRWWFPVSAFFILFLLTLAWCLLNLIPSNMSCKIPYYLPQWQHRNSWWHMTYYHGAYGGATASSTTTFHHHQMPQSPENHANASKVWTGSSADCSLLYT
jgi:hypothetical protein